MLAVCPSASRVIQDRFRTFDAMAAPPTETRAAIAHVLRRTTFGPHPGQVDAFGSGSVDDALHQVLTAPAPALDAPKLGSDHDEELLTTWWLKRMARPDVGLAEKMTWFWHTHFTSGFDKVR